jgi:hypothetical protein
MPTERQIQEAHEKVASLSPGARIKCVGPEGVTFEYPDQGKITDPGWTGKPFGSEDE